MNPTLTRFEREVNAIVGGFAFPDDTDLTNLNAANRPCPDAHKLAPARGLLIAVALGLVIWGLVLLGAWFAAGPAVNAWLNQLNQR